MAVSAIELRRRGYDDEDIAPYRTLAEILAGQKTRPRLLAPPEDPPASSAGAAGSVRPPCSPIRPPSRRMIPTGRRRCATMPKD